MVLGLGIGCFVFDAIYTGMLYSKFHELGLNPFTRKPVAADAALDTASPLPSH